VGEWEDLLFRLELGPRAMRVALEDRHDAAERLEACLNWLASVEKWASYALEAMRQGGEVAGVEDFAVEPADVASADAVGQLFAAYATARARNFAALQRRGLGVWDWHARLKGGGVVSACQLVHQLLRADAAVLAEARRAGDEA
jgi:hypothetical protein